MARSRTSRMDVVYGCRLHEDFELSRRLVSPRSHVKKKRKKKKAGIFNFSRNRGAEKDNRA